MESNSRAPALEVIRVRNSMSGGSLFQNIGPATANARLPKFVLLRGTWRSPITEAKQYAGLGRAEPGLEPGRWIFQPGHLTWGSLA